MGHERSGRKGVREGNGSGWREGAVVQSTGSQHPHGNSLTAISLGSRGSEVAFWTLWAPGTCDSQTHVQAKHT